MSRDRTEIYRQTPFALRQGRWVPEEEDESARRIFWPARGEVRIIIHSAVESTPQMYEQIAEEVPATRREDGALGYAWYENVDLPGHLLLLELWADQVRYDRHWQLRGATAAHVGPSLRVPTQPQRGRVSREFYRRELFRAHYDRWLPADLDQASSTIDYPAG